MLLSKRSIDTLKWMDIRGLVPKSFNGYDQFVSEGGTVYSLADANPHEVMWVPRLRVVSRILSKAFGVEVSLITKESVLMVVTDFFGKRVEGAGVTEQEALFSFLERFKDAYFERRSGSDRLGAG